MDPVGRAVLCVLLAARSRVPAGLLPRWPGRTARREQPNADRDRGRDLVAGAVESVEGMDCTFSAFLDGRNIHHHRRLSAPTGVTRSADLDLLGVWVARP